VSEPARSLLLAGLLFSALGCQAPKVSAGDDGGLQLFIAQPADFGGFGDWMSHTIVGAPPEGSPHTTGMRTVYLNHAPAHGAKLFAVGTIIVKTVHSSPGDMTLDQTFAMAKRGGNYDAGGAAGWEWFELDTTVDPPDIIWRGVAPPAGIVYSTVSAVDCSGCHAAARANDYVQDPGLQLSSF
jgi:hypothetical protein